ncbi:hypothetical protein C0992_008572 [Termitomyces sp. T32_za158]|nr:hypothetical protein C0992_008572 [Termitomyces sp. T32_za158]
MTCSGCSGAVSRVLDKAKGTGDVSDYSVSLETQEVRVTSRLPYDDILAKIQKTGKEVCANDLAFSPLRPNFRAGQVRDYFGMNCSIILLAIHCIRFSDISNAFLYVIDFTLIGRYTRRSVCEQPVFRKALFAIQSSISQRQARRMVRTFIEKLLWSSPFCDITRMRPGGKQESKKSGPECFEPYEELLLCRSQVKTASLFTSVSALRRLSASRFISGRQKFSMASNIIVPDGFTLHTENTSHILLESNQAFLNPVQEFNRDTSVACIRVWSEELNRSKGERWRQNQERRTKKQKEGVSKKRKAESEETSQIGEPSASIDGSGDAVRSTSPEVRQLSEPNGKVLIGKKAL